MGYRFGIYGIELTSEQSAHLDDYAGIARETYGDVEMVVRVEKRAPARAGRGERLIFSVTPAADDARATPARGEA